MSVSLQWTPFHKNKRNWIGFAREALRDMRFEANDFAEGVKDQLATYPSPPGGRHNPYLTPKQRRFLAIAMRRGTIRIPYQRTGHLRESWFLRTKTRGDGGFTIFIRNSASYARWVYGRRSQYRYHRDTGWKTIQFADRLRGVYTQRLFRALQRAARRS